MSDTLITEGLVALSEAIKSGRKKKRGRKKGVKSAIKRLVPNKRFVRDVSFYGTGVAVGMGLPQKAYRKLNNMRYYG